jgi:hypothetical protein
MPAAEVGAAFVAAAGLALLATACGGSSRNAEAQHGSAAVGFAECMRSSGVPRYPDPDSSAVAKPSLQQLGVSSSRFDVAQSACRHLLPNGGRPPNQAEQHQVRVEALSFSRCVRVHGVAGFPDPDSTGRIPDPGSVGIDQGSPVFEAANQACRQYRPPYMPSNSAYNAWARTHGGS